MTNSICIFCGSSDKIDTSYQSAAHQMGVAVAKRGDTIIYGGGSTGLMGALANGALENQGEVIGVLPRLFDTPQLAHPNLTRMEIVDGMHQRKARMIELADAFIALPGGYGTFEELFEILTWAQIGIHTKPIGLLNVHGYFDPLLLLVEHAKVEGFIYAEHRGLFTCDPQPEILLDRLQAYQPPPGLSRWIDR